MMPVRPPMRNMDRKAEQKSIGEAKETRPPYLVASQVKNSMPAGREIMAVDTMKNRAAAGRLPTPLPIKPSARKSVAPERAKVRSVNGAYANQPMAGAPPVAKLK